MRKMLLISFFLVSVNLQAQTRLIVLDVKEGQSVLLKHNNEGLLVDTGHAGQSASLLKKLHQYGVEKVKSIILTHLHPDHASGYFRLKEAFPLAKIFSNCHPLPVNVQPDITRWLNEALQSDQEHRCLKAGDTHKFYNAELSVLWPYEFVNNNLNQHSLVINISIDKSNVLIMGDAGFNEEQALYDEKKLQKNITALIAGHHGANDATSMQFLRRVKPGIAVISVNKDNVRGYPSRETIKRLKELNIKIFRTDIHGDIDVYK